MSHIASDYPAGHFSGLKAFACRYRRDVNGTVIRQLVWITEGAADLQATSHGRNDRDCMCLRCAGNVGEVSSPASVTRAVEADCCLHARHLAMGNFLLSPCQYLLADHQLPVLMAILIVFAITFSPLFIAYFASDLL